MAIIVVSNCLIGCNCRYDGKNCRSKDVRALAKGNVLIGVCPEQAGGLATPRNPAEIQGRKVISSAGKNVTREYARGAKAALDLAKLNKAQYAVLKAKSPSCGKGVIYDGTFTGGKTEGNGVTAQLFLDNGIEVFTEDEIDRLKNVLKGTNSKG